jgi:hypothetical protein
MDEKERKRDTGGRGGLACLNNGKKWMPGQQVMEM